MNVSITLVPRGGLANRMRAIASASALATRIGAKLNVVWIATKDLTALYSDLFLTDNLPFRLTEYSHRKFAYLPHRRKYLYLPTLWQSVRYSLTLRDERSRDRYYLTDAEPETVYAFFRSVGTGTVFVDTCYQFYPFSADLYRSLFRPSPNVEMRIRQLLPDIGRGIQPPIGIHIRRTDHVWSIQNSPLSLFEKEIGEIVSAEPQRKFYLATDDDATKEHLTSLFPANIITSPATASRSSRNGMIDGAAEMFVLSRCQLILGSFFSSYSEAAAMLGDISLKIIKN